MYDIDDFIVIEEQKETGNNTDDEKEQEKENEKEKEKEYVNGSELTLISFFYEMIFNCYDNIKNIIKDLKININLIINGFS